MKTSKLFTVTVVAEIELIDSTTGLEDDTLKHLTDEIQKTADALSTRVIKSVRVVYCGGGIGS
jgi:hypothetical protein